VFFGPVIFSDPVLCGFFRASLPFFAAAPNAVETEEYVQQMNGGRIPPE